MLRAYWITAGPGALISAGRSLSPSRPASEENVLIHDVSTFDNTTQSSYIRIYIIYGAKRGSEGLEANSENRSNHLSDVSNSDFFFFVNCNLTFFYSSDSTLSRAAFAIVAIVTHSDILLLLLLHTVPVDVYRSQFQLLILEET